MCVQFSLQNLVRRWTSDVMLCSGFLALFMCKLTHIRRVLASWKGSVDIKLCARRVGCQRKAIPHLITCNRTHPLEEPKMLRRVGIFCSCMCKCNCWTSTQTQRSQTVQCLCVFMSFCLSLATILPSHTYMQVFSLFFIILMHKFVTPRHTALTDMRSSFLYITNVLNECAHVSLWQWLIREAENGVSHHSVSLFSLLFALFHSTVYLKRAQCVASGFSKCMSCKRVFVTCQALPKASLALLGHRGKRVCVCMCVYTRACPLTRNR